MNTVISVLEKGGDFADRQLGGGFLRSTVRYDLRRYTVKLI